MSILQEILGWAKGLAPWQSDAVSRLFTKETLTPDDLDDLYALMKAEHGIPDPKGRKASPIADDKIPAGAQDPALRCTEWLCLPSLSCAFSSATK